MMLSTAGALHADTFDLQTATIEDINRAFDAGALTSEKLVRLYLASAMQRTPIAQRKPILETLIGHAEDAADQNLPLMYWYALEPVVGGDAKSAVGMLAKTKIPKVRELITRRMAAK